MTPTEYFISLGSRGSKPGLERIKSLLRLLGDPQYKLRAVHVAGTNGKGSVCRMLESILCAAGYKTGLFTSPYITVPHECIRAGGRDISEDEFDRLCGRICRAEQKMNDGPTEFEALTAMAFLYFAECGCETVIIETGMGGRIDATNVIKEPLLSIITGVESDHTEYLGSTIGEIAGEKAGIIKPRRPVVFGGYDPEALGVIRAECERQSASLELVDYERLNVRRMTLGGTEFDFGGLKNLNIPLLGAYQPRNAAVALTAAEFISGMGCKISEEALRSGLGSVKWRGRFELLAADPIVIYDGAHNLQGMTAAVESIKMYFSGKAVLLMGVMRDKDYENMAKIIAPYVKEAFTVTPDNPRSLPADRLAACFEELGVSAVPCGSVKDGLPLALDAAKGDKLPLVILGSLYFYKDIQI